MITYNHPAVIEHLENLDPTEREHLIAEYRGEIAYYTRALETGGENISDQAYEHFQFARISREVRIGLLEMTDPNLEL